MTAMQLMKITLSVDALEVRSPVEDTQSRAMRRDCLPLMELRQRAKYHREGLAGMDLLLGVI